MERPEKSPLKTNSSVPDIVFYQLELDKEENVMGFIDNDSEEHFGKLARKGGEILLPGVYPQKTRADEDLDKHADGHSRKGKPEVKVDIPASDTELETLLFYGRSSSSELRFLKREDERARKFGSSDDEATQAEKREENGEGGKRNRKDGSVGKVRRSEEPEDETFAVKRAFGKGGKSGCREPERDDASEATLQGERPAEEASEEGSKSGNWRK